MAFSRNTSKPLLAMSLLLQLGATEALAVTSWNELRSRDVVMQEQELSCGAASIAMVLQRLYGESITEKQALDAMKTNGVAASFAQMAAGLNELGYDARAVAMNFDELRQLTVPIILFLRSSLSRLGIGHFVVLERVTEDGVIYRDPTFGNRVLDITTFRAYWETRDDKTRPGRALIVMPKTPEQRQRVVDYRPPEVRPIELLRPAF